MLCALPHLVDKERLHQVAHGNWHVGGDGLTSATITRNPTYFLGLSGKEVEWSELSGVS